MKGRIWSEGVLEQSAEENVWTQVGESNKTLEKIAL
jgi:hypothetical protein